MVTSFNIDFHVEGNYDPLWATLIPDMSNSATIAQPTGINSVAMVVNAEGASLQSNIEPSEYLNVTQAAESVLYFRKLLLLLLLLIM